MRIWTDITIPQMPNIERKPHYVLLTMTVNRILFYLLWDETQSTIEFRPHFHSCRPWENSCCMFEINMLRNKSTLYPLRKKYLFVSENLLKSKWSMLFISTYVLPENVNKDVRSIISWKRNTNALRNNHENAAVAVECLPYVRSRTVGEYSSFWSNSIYPISFDSKYYVNFIPLYFTWKTLHNEW